MSFNNINTEYRSVRFIQSIPPPRRRPCCSFCRQPGHNIRFCNSERLLEFEVICASEVRFYDSRAQFKQWINHNYVNSNQMLLIAFSIKKFGVNRRTNINICVTLIVDYIFRTYKMNSAYSETNSISNYYVLERTRILEILFSYFETNETFQNMNNQLPQLNYEVIVDRCESQDENELCDCSICWEEKERKT